MLTLDFRGGARTRGVPLRNALRSHDECKPKFLGFGTYINNIMTQTLASLPASQPQKTLDSLLFSFLCVFGLVKFILEIRSLEEGRRS